MVLYKIARNKDSVAVSKHYSLGSARDALLDRHDKGRGKGYYIFRINRNKVIDGKSVWEKIPSTIFNL